MCVPRFRRLLQQGPFVFLLVALSGCILSDYDVSRELKQVFPLESNTYLAKSNTLFDGSVFTVIQTVDGYDFFIQYGTNALERGTARVFQIPRYSGFVVQYLKDGSRTFGYAFAEPVNNGFRYYYGPTMTGV